MKTKILLFVLISMGYFSFIPFGNDNAVEKHAETCLTIDGNSWSKSFSGLIDGKYKIHLRLINDNGSLSGYYFYESVGKNLQLKGKMAKDGKISINEINSKGKTTGVFNGQLIKASFTGNWMNAKGTKKLPFALEEKKFSSNCDEVTIAKKKLKLIDDELMKITVPKVSTGNKALKKRLSYLLSAEKLTGRSINGLNELITEYQENMMPHGIVEYDYTLNYNKNCLLSLTGIKVTMGAHFYYFSENINLELSSGLDVQITDIIKSDKMEQLARVCNKKLQDAINNTIDADNLNDSPEIVEMLRSYSFTVKHLNQFIIKDESLVFIYNFDLPHVYRYATPDTNLSFDFENLKDYIKPNGALHFIL